MIFIQSIFTARFRSNSRYSSMSRSSFRLMSVSQSIPVWFMGHEPWFTSMLKFRSKTYTSCDQCFKFRLFGFGPGRLGLEIPPGRAGPFPKKNRFDVKLFK